MASLRDGHFGVRSAYRQGAGTVTKRDVVASPVQGTDQRAKLRLPMRRKFKTIGGPPTAEDL